MKTNRYSTTRVLVRDYPAALAFYRDTLGLTVVQMIGDDNGPYCELGLGEVQDSHGRIALYPRAWFSGSVLPIPDAPNSNAVVIAVHVPQLLDFVDALSQRGVVLAVPLTTREDWGLRTAHLRDPDGNIVELFEWLA